jgi:hypothetical protein
MPIACRSQSLTKTWSLHDCDVCDSTIMDPGWYSDGSGLFTEAMQIGDGYVTVALSVMDHNLVAALGFAAGPGKSFPINPRESVTIASDSSPNMILFAANGPATKLGSGDLAMKKQFKLNTTFSVKPDHVIAGYLFFPNDADGSTFTVIVNFANSTFRFPLRRKQNSRAKFGALEAVIPSTLAPPKSRDGTGDTSPTAELVTSLKGSSFQANRTSDLQPISGLTIKAHGKNSLPKSISGCQENISFASIEGGQLYSAGPSFTQKWVEKNSRKYPTACFSQTPSATSSNILFVFSTSAESFVGLYPTTRTNRATSTNPVQGSGTVTDNYGGTWNYNYAGTVTTTTTTTSRIELPYVDTTRNLFLYVYDWNGTLLWRFARSRTMREGGDGMNTLGYNLGSILTSMHMEDHILQEAVSKIAK